MGEWRYKLHAFLTSALDGGEWSASRTSCFTLEGGEEKGILGPAGNLTPVVQSVT